MATKVWTLAILICCIWNVHSLILKTIGVYSICGENYTQHEFTEHAFATNLTASVAIEDMYFDDGYLRLFTNITYTYKSFDVCYDAEKLVSTVTNFLLDSEFYAVNKSVVIEERTWVEAWINQSMVGQEKVEYFEIKAERCTMILAIFTYIPPDFLQMLLDFMSLETVLISKHSLFVRPTERMSGYDNFYDMEYNFNDVEDYLIKQKWEDVIAIHLKKGDLHTSSFNSLVKMLNHTSDVCVKTLTINDAKQMASLVQDIEKVHKRNRTKNFIMILVGGGSHLPEPTPLPDEIMYWKYINESASYFERIVVLHPTRRSTKINPFEVYENSSPFMWYVVFNNELRELVEDQEMQKETLYRLLEDYRNDTVFNTIQTNLTAYFAFFNFVNFMKESIFYADREQNSWSNLLAAINQVQDSRLRKSEIWERLPPYVENKCYQPSCLPGYEKVFGKLSNKKALWDEEFAYYCQPCELNFIKPSRGDDRCQPCMEYFVSNPQKTKCIDPLLAIHHKPSDMSGIITLIMCSIGSLLCLFTILIFMKYRETLIVKASDFTMSLIHLIAILLFFCSAPVLYFTVPKSEICMVRTVSIALFYNLNISIIFTKSNKLVRAFSANVRSTRNEVLKTTLVQAFSIIINLLSACVLVFLFWTHKYPEIAVRLDIEHTKKYLYCNNAYENIALSGLMLLLHLACFIQAFRCRKLPGHISEAMSIVYASFFVTVSICVMFPIAFFQEYEEYRELVLVLVLSGNNLILFLFMYAKKLFIIVFRPQKNTKAYFRRKQMEMIEAKARNI